MRLSKVFGSVCFSLLIGFSLLFPVISNAKIVLVAQSKPRYMRVEIPKLETSKREKLMDELRSYEEKVIAVSYTEDNRQLLIYYSDLVSADDILQVISKYTGDFTKISGTEWP